MPFTETLEADADSPSAKRGKGKRVEAKERARQTALIERINDSIKTCEDGPHSKWVDEAQKCERFYNNHQWESDDLDRLKDQKRAGLTMNRIAKKVDLVDGTEIYHRQKVIFLPKQPNRDGTAGTSDLATDAVDWVIENCKGIHERSRVWHDSNVRGVGCEAITMDHSEDPRGRILLKRTDSYEMRWDPNAREQNLEDARWIARRSWWHIDDIRSTFGDDKADKIEKVQLKDAQLPNPSSSPGDDEALPTKVVNHGPNLFAADGQEVSPTAPEKRQKGMHKVTEYQWWEREPCMLVVDDGSDIFGAEEKPEMAIPEDPAAMPPDPAALEQAMMPPPPEVAPMPGEMPPAPPEAAAAMPPPGATPPGTPPSPEGMGAVVPPGQTPLDGAPPAAPPPPEEPVEKILTLGMDEWEKLALRLEEAGLPLPPAVQGERRAYKQAFLTDDVLLDDGDMWIQAFSYLFLTHKYDQEEKLWYGMIRNLLDAQRGANKFFSQGVDVWNSGAKGALIIETNAAASSKTLGDTWAGPSPIILMNPGGVTNRQYEVIPPPDFPPAAAQMTQFSLEAINDIGPSEAMTGQQMGGETPGISVQKAQVQGMTTLAPNFDALTRFRYTEAKTIIKAVREFLLDGRLIRIGGPHNSRFEKLLAERFSDDYDLVIDEVPRDPNARRQVWEMLGPLLPIAFRSGKIPHAWKDFSPFPASVIEDWKKQEDEEAAAASQAPPPLEQMPEYIAAKVAQEAATAKLKEAQAMLAMARAQALTREAGVSTLETLADIENEKKRLQNEQQLGIRDQAHKEDQDTLNAMTAARREMKPASPGVKSTP
jgi:hypothetical protein